MNLAYLLSQWLPPVQESILSHLCPEDFTALSLVSKDVHDALEDGLRSSCFNINAKLFKFFKDPKAFRQIQAQTGAVIGDDFARKFFANKLQGDETILVDGLDKLLADGGSYDTLVFQDVPNVLHIYIQYQQHKLEKPLTALSQHIESDGWSSCCNDEPARVYQKKNRSGRLLRIQLHICADSVIWQLLDSAPTTAAMNFITWNKAYALFPKVTFIENEGYRLRNLLGRPQADVRFWNHVKSLYHDDFQLRGMSYHDIKMNDLRSNEVTRIRRIGDERTWTISLDTSCLGPIRPLTPDVVIESSTFEITVKDTDPRTRYALGAMTFSHPILKHSYSLVTGDFHLMIPWLLEEMDRLTRLELMKLPEDKRPVEYADLVETGDEDDDDWESTTSSNESDYMKTTLSTFRWDEGQVPETWTYFDDELVKHLRELWKPQTEKQKERDAWRDRKRFEAEKEDEE